MKQVNYILEINFVKIFNYPIQASVGNKSYLFHFSSQLTLWFFNQIEIFDILLYISDDFMMSNIIHNAVTIEIKRNIKIKKETILQK